MPTSELHGKDVNVWQSEKITLNNGVYEKGGEVDAYKVYRDAGIISPLAEYTTIRLFRGEELRVGPFVYTAVETINDKAFAKKYFGSHYAMWEMEQGVPEYKRSKGDFKDIYEVDGATNCDECAASTPACEFCAPKNLTTLSMEHLDEDTMLRYSASELITENWDGACYASNHQLSNYYIVINTTGTYTFVPHGLDRAYTCSAWWWRPHRDAHCTPMIECLGDDACTVRAEDTYDIVFDGAHRHPRGRCPLPWWILILILVACFGVIYAVYRWGHCWQFSAQQQKNTYSHTYMLF